MILKSIQPINYGPFASEQTLHVDPKVTVLTGANDTGKSSLLGLIHRLYGGNIPLTAKEYNRERMGNVPDRWQSDTELGCIAAFEITEGSSEYMRGGTQYLSGDVVHFRFNMAPQARSASFLKAMRGKSSFGASTVPGRMPKVISLPLAHEISDTIDIAAMNPAEEQLIRLGFGEKVSPDHLASFGEDEMSFLIDQSQAKLNTQLRQILPPSLSLQFRLREVADTPTRIRFSLVDSQQAITPLGHRGTGVRKVLGLMGALLSAHTDKEYTVILVDEPETSLHADAQHMLRRILEGLAGRPNIQVIYATHSPSMINTMRPGAIRVLKRGRIDNKATSVILNNPFDKNFFAVRSSLGLNPADSLLYAPITVVVEGPTEVRCLPVLLEGFEAAGLEGFDDVETVLSQAHFLDGEGDSYERLCALAESQNAKPVVFLDGDKVVGQAKANVEKFKASRPGVPVVHLPPGTEFEDIVPPEKYIEAVAAVLEDLSGEVTHPAFLAWKAGRGEKVPRGFSKQVERWLEQSFGKPLYKGRVMLKAIELGGVAPINPEPFRQLLNEMKLVGGLA